ncbi:hypothetical protein ACFYRY_26070 [Streptomyces sp. NPDC005263]|uniref:hypothetical protein n=1 Tax=Streptomyces sp. NPDC005263 TaxID=3364711 RepID=UPI0036A253DA
MTAKDTSHKSLQNTNYLDQMPSNASQDAGVQFDAFAAQQSNGRLPSENPVRPA